MSGLGVAACATLDVDDYCRYSETRSMREADPEALTLVLGVQPGRKMNTPFVVFRSRSENKPGASLTLTATAAPVPMPENLDESRCSRVDWTTYNLVVDRADWDTFWANEGTIPVEFGIAFLDDNQPMLMSDFGAAILDGAASDYLLACGCYWK